MEKTTELCDRISDDELKELQRLGMEWAEAAHIERITHIEFNLYKSKMTAKYGKDLDNYFLDSTTGMFRKREPVIKS